MIEYLVGNYKYWAWFASLNLIYLTYSDFKNNMNVNTRPNWVMTGVSITLLTHTHIKIWYMLLLALVIAGFSYGLSKSGQIGGADIETIAWMMLGYGILSPGFLVYFLFVLLAISIIYFGIKGAMKIKHPTPFYLPLFVVFILTSATLGLY